MRIDPVRTTRVRVVLEHEDLRRASDLEHFRLARRLGRTLITQDRDYTDGRRMVKIYDLADMQAKAADLQTVLKAWLQTIK